MSPEFERVSDWIRDVGVVALEWQQKQTELQFEEKDFNAGPVTEADRRANRMIIERICEDFSNDWILGEEESYQPNEQAEVYWWVDPIDGTKSFIEKTDEWSVMIGRVDRSGITHGWIYQPGKDILYLAERNSGAFRIENGKSPEKMSVSRKKRIEELTLVVSRHHSSSKVDRAMNRLGIKNYYEHGSVGLKISHIAEGRADLYLNFAGKCSRWDLCAAEIILSEAGGELQTLEGGKIDYRVHSPPEVGSPYFAGFSDSLSQVRDRL